MTEDVRKLIEAAILAPSGENCQPWRFAAEGDTIKLFNDPLSDVSLYNEKQRGALIAHGAAIENMAIRASALGLSLDISYFPEEKNPDLIASISIKKIPGMPDGLEKYIPRRSTNRKKYNKVALPDAKLKELADSAKEIGAGEVQFVVDEAKIKDLARSMSMNEWMIFKNKSLHNFFYDHIRWTKEENDQDSTGFFVKTFELDPKQSKGFRLFKHWPALKLMNMVAGAANLVAKDNEANYASASAIGIVTFKTNAPKDYVMAGRVMERLWLKVTGMGLSLQPSTGILFLMQALQDGKRGPFSKGEIERIEMTYAHIRTVFNLRQKQDTIMMMFRIGDGGEPSARASRQKIDHFIKS